MFESDFIRLRLKCMLCVFNTSDSESMKQHFDEHEARVNRKRHNLAFIVRICTNLVHEYTCTQLW